ncbi:hypothetical protein CI610_03431 [invertebrate metagenome]|uniref:Uncharacterized protein n=1 Tax=invertebrate metagenome TaxID=1711999 RepID=A0A2H9T369_9ZZZZ
MLIFSISYCTKLMAEGLLLLSFLSNITSQPAPVSMKVYHPEAEAYCVPTFNCIGYNYGIELCHQENGYDECVRCDEGYASTRRIKHSLQVYLPNSHKCRKKHPESISYHCPENTIPSTDYNHNETVCDNVACICDIDKCSFGDSACNCVNLSDKCPENQEMNEDGVCNRCQTALGFYRHGIGCENCMMNMTELTTVIQGPLIPEKNNVFLITDATPIGSSLIVEGILEYFSHLRYSENHHYFLKNRHMVSEPTSVQLEFVVRMLNTESCTMMPANRSIFIFIKDTAKCGVKPCPTKYLKMFLYDLPDEAKKTQFQTSKEIRQAQSFENDPVETTDGEKYTDFKGYWFFKPGNCPIVDDSKPENKTVTIRRFRVDISTEFGSENFKIQKSDDKRLYRKLKSKVKQMIESYSSPNNIDYDDLNDYNHKKKAQVYLIHRYIMTRHKMQP